MRRPTGTLKPDDMATVTAAMQVLSGETKKKGIARLLPFLGPAFIASIAYVDPGNFATNIESGAKYGYMLLWVVVASNLMAMLIQVLSAKVGIATGYNLAEKKSKRKRLIHHLEHVDGWSRLHIHGSIDFENS